MLIREENSKLFRMKTRLNNMDKIKLMQFILHFMILEKKASSLTVKTEDVVIDLQDDNRITLNCTYYINSTGEISKRDIRWQKQINGTFQDVALFSPPGGPPPFITKDIVNLYENRTELIGPNISLSAVMIIKDPVCTDEGTYKCWIEYFLGTIKHGEAFSSVAFITKASNPKELLVFPDEVEENKSITIYCIADVGSPQGYIQIWKKTKKSITAEVIYKSTPTNSKTENCTELINVTITHILTREDNGAFFQCSSKNNFTKDPIPIIDSSNISVLYGPNKPTITLTPIKAVYTVGDFLTIQCSSDSNPPSVFTWSFKPQHKSGNNRIGYSNDKSKLVFERIQTENAGNYTCTVNNTERPGYPNMTSFVSVHVINSEEKYSGCNQCGYLETCQQSNEKTFCVSNFWVPIAVVFILLSAAFAVSSIVMIMQRKRTQESTATNNILFENKSPSSDGTPGEIHGGYISPADLEFGCLPPNVTQEGKGAAYSRL